MLDSVDVFCVRPFWAFGYLKGHFVTFLEVLELNVLQLVRVEKEIFFLALPLDEPESPVGKPSNCSFFHVLKGLVYKCQIENFEE